ncbi:MacS family sensor histidine kinase [Gordonia aichiensis]|uniref:Putative two-component histidine kinase n=1 Tax=Gordonia aichiensis NBRC 108223 TaxID=1220583 RepID=L7KNR1_9ACTN|nr:DUF5931 domain-containing protein [Gordonia aichiensis]GAC50475.1 putative two-component histidine kinase [Gordonia aichiensis NBRC 108223]
MRSDPVTPLWRGAQVLRLLSYLYALGFRIAIDDGLVHPGVAWVLFGFLTVWTVACGVAYYVGFGRNWYWVGAELVIACGLMLSTSYVASESWALNNQTWPTTLWATNAVISAALLAGPIVGLAAGLVVGGTSAFVKGWLDLNFGRNASIIVMLVSGVAVGLAAVNARRAHAELAAAAQIAAAAAERERLSREVHDGVLQVLSFISKRGRELGGPTAELAELAATQEAALRRLITDVDGGAEAACGTADLTALLRAAGGDGTAVSAPAEPVVIDATTAREISAAVINALDNVAHHAGPGARAFVLLEDLDDTVVVSVRDDGVGIAAGRLDEARRQGRLGVAQSIVGRIESLGGTAILDSDEGIGTEWELTVPVTRVTR